MLFEVSSTLESMVPMEIIYNITHRYKLSKGKM